MSPICNYTLLEDAWTDNPNDGQATFDALGSNVKELFWIEGTSRRFDGYNYFGNNPERMLAWFDRHL